jgi:hypothetical protein
LDVLGEAWRAETEAGRRLPNERSRDKRIPTRAPLGFQRPQPLAALSSISVCTEMEPPEARAVSSTESLSVKRTALINPQSALRR